MGRFNFWSHSWSSIRIPQGQTTKNNRLYRKLVLEVLEDRWTPSATSTTYLADGVISGSVLSSTRYISGVEVILSGTTSSGKQVSYETTTNGNGAYRFQSVLPGQYELSSTTPNGFLGGATPFTGISLNQGQTLSSQNLGLSNFGFTSNNVSLIAFESDFSNSIVNTLQAPLPSAGTGIATAFSLANSISLGDQTVTPPTSSTATPTPTYINLASYFTDPATTNPIVTINTTLGPINVELFANDDPATVTNFLDYIESGSYNDSIFNRMSNLSQTSSESTIPMPYQVLQGGGFGFTADSSKNVTGFTSINTFQSIPNESNDAAHANVAGSLAMARSSAANSATSQFFFNLTDNSSALGNTAGNGYAVFGQVEASSLNTLKQFASQFTPNDQTGNMGLSSSIRSNLYSLPLLNGFTPTKNSATLGATSSDLAAITSVNVPTLTGKLTYSNISSSNSAITATLGTNSTSSSISADQLEINAASGTTSGTTSTISMVVTDAAGDSMNYSFKVTVN